jgi:hypothetical protein
MSVERGEYGRDGKYMQIFGGKNKGAVGEDGEIAMKWVFKNQDGRMLTCFCWRRVKE